MFPGFLIRVCLAASLLPAGGGAVQVADRGQQIAKDFVQALLNGNVPGVTQTLSLQNVYTREHRALEVSELQEILRTCSLESERPMFFRRQDSSITARLFEWTCPARVRDERALTTVFEVAGGEVTTGRVLFMSPTRRTSPMPKGE